MALAEVSVLRSLLNARRHALSNGGDRRFISRGQIHLDLSAEQSCPSWLHDSSPQPKLGQIIEGFIALLALPSRSLFKNAFDDISLYQGSLGKLSSSIVVGAEWQP